MGKATAFQADDPPGSNIRRESPGGLREHDRLVRQPWRGDTATGTGYGSMDRRWGDREGCEGDAVGGQPATRGRGQRAVHATRRLVGRDVHLHV